jgi:hypothetical protein
MPQRAVGIPQNRERAALQSIKHRSWVPHTALHPAGEGTIASMLRKGWIAQQFSVGGTPLFRITGAGQGRDCRQNSGRPLRALKRPAPVTELSGSRADTDSNAQIGPWQIQNRPVKCSDQGARTCPRQRRALSEYATVGRSRFLRIQPRGRPHFKRGH